VCFPVLVPVGGVVLFRRRFVCDSFNIQCTSRINKVKTHTTCCNVTNFCSFPHIAIMFFHVVFEINKERIPVRHYGTNLHNCDTEIDLLYNLDKGRFQNVKFV
jgi:hypothetical protein